MSSSRTVSCRLTIPRGPRHRRPVSRPDTATVSSSRGAPIRSLIVVVTTMVSAALDERAARSAPPAGNVGGPPGCGRHRAFARRSSSSRLASAAASSRRFMVTRLEGSAGPTAGDGTWWTPASKRSGTPGSGSCAVRLPLPNRPARPARRISGSMTSRSAVSSATRATSWTGLVCPIRFTRPHR